MPHHKLSLTPVPLLMLIGGTKVPWGVSEYDFCGGLRGRRMTLTSAPTTRTRYQSHRKSYSTVSLLRARRATKGPYGEWTGYIAGTYKKANGFVRLLDVAGDSSR